MFTLEDLILSRWQYSQADLHIQHNSYQIPKHLLHRNQKDDPKKKNMEMQGIQNSQNNLEKEEQSWMTHTSWFQSLVQNYNNPDSGIPA